MLELANQFNNQNILIYGFGKSGRACFKYLRKNNKIEIYDDKKSSIPKKLKKNSINKTKLTSVNFDRIVVSPGIDINKCTLKKYLSKNKSKIISEMDEFYSCEFDIGDIVRSGLVRSYIIQKYNTGLGDRK